ncbi:hypothetical protein BH09VER1_BH09VER1_10250 [soil metagenome]
MKYLRVGLFLVAIFLLDGISLARAVDLLPSEAAASLTTDPGQIRANNHDRATGFLEGRFGLVAVVGLVLVFQFLFLVVLFLIGKAHKLTEQSLAQSEERMSLEASSADLGMWAWDIKSDLVSATTEMRRLLSLPHDEPLNYQQCLGKFHPMDRSIVERAVQRGIQCREDYTEEARTVSPGGTVRWLELHGTIKRDEQGVPIKMTGVVLDSTARKVAESRLERQREDLSRQSRKNLLGEMAASLSHELGQPLGAAVNSAAAAQRLLEQGRIKEASENLRIVIEAGLKGGAVLETMKKMTGREVPKRYPIQINQLISETIRIASPDMQNRGFAVEVKLADRLPVILGDPVEIQQVILNILMNAFDAAAGYPRERRNVVISTRGDGEDGVEVSIRDFGEGICEEAKTRLFDRFFSTKENGVGMGLSIARSIIDTHGGMLENVNEDMGALFRFTLPAAKTFAR